MDISELNEDQVNKAFQLCDIMSIEDISLAIAILSSSNWNLESVLQQVALPHQNNQPAPYQNQPQMINPAYYDNDQVEQQQFPYSNGQIEDEIMKQTMKQSKIQQFNKQFQSSQKSLLPFSKTASQPTKQLQALKYHKKLAIDFKTHRNKYLQEVLNQSMEVCQKILVNDEINKNKYKNNARKIGNNQKFINHLYTNYNPKINFTFGTFYLNLIRSHIQNKTLLVYVHTITSSTQEKFKSVTSLLFNDAACSKFINKNCITYGMFDNSDDFQNIQKYIPLKQLPAFGLFSFNKGNKSEQFVSFYKISEKNKEFLQWLTANVSVGLKNNNNVAQEESKQEIKVKTPEQKQLKKKQEYVTNTYIRKEQDQLWQQMQKTYIMKKQLSLQKKQHIVNLEEELQKRIQEASKYVEPQHGQNVIEIRFRMPLSGQSKSRRFLNTEIIQQLFTYVDCFCRDEFQQRFNDFDLKQTFPPISLKEFRQKPIKQVFQGSQKENMMVRQL